MPDDFKELYSGCKGFDIEDLLSIIPEVWGTVIETFLSAGIEVHLEAAGSSKQLRLDVV